MQRFGLRMIPIVVAAGMAMVGAGNADACPGFGKGRASLLSRSLLRAALFPRIAVHPGQAVNNSFVGLWQVTYTSGGELWDMSFDTWHFDGTEFENAMDSPLISAVCQGVWEMAGPKTVKLHHMGWSYDSTGTVLLGTFTMDQTNTLTNDGNGYTGVFTFQPYDLDGNPAGEPTKGTVSAMRVTVP